MRRKKNFIKCSGSQVNSTIKTSFWIERVSMRGRARVYVYIYLYLSMNVWKSYLVIRLPIQSIILSNVHHIYHAFSYFYWLFSTTRWCYLEHIHLKKKKTNEEQDDDEDWNVLSTYFTYSCLFYDYISTKFIAVHLLPALSLSHSLTPCLYLLKINVCLLWLNSWHLAHFQPFKK